MKKLNKTFPFLLALLIVLLVALPVASFPAFFLNKTDMHSYGQLYANSQYVRGEATNQRIDDATLYIYAGFAYLQGEDPTTVNFEHPPLGKYLFGLSYLIFQNSLILNLVVYAAFLAVFVSLIRLFTKNTLVILATVLFLGTTRLIYVNVGQGMLDIFATLLLLALFRTLFSQLSPRYKYLLSGLFIGGIAATKYPFPSLLLPLAVTFFWSFRSKEFIASLLLIPSALSVYLGSYTVYFMQHSLKDFLAFEWFRLKWWVVDRNIPPFLIFHTLFWGSFQDWRTLHTVTSAVWSPALPLVFVSHYVAVLFAKVDARLLVLVGYSSMQLALFAVGSASYDRYFIGLLPFWLIAIAAGFSGYGKKESLVAWLNNT